MLLDDQITAFMYKITINMKSDFRNKVKAATKPRPPYISFLLECLIF